MSLNFDNKNILVIGEAGLAEELLRALSNITQMFVSLELDRVLMIMMKLYLKVSENVNIES